MYDGRMVIGGNISAGSNTLSIRYYSLAYGGLQGMAIRLQAVQEGVSLSLPARIYPYFLLRAGGQAQWWPTAQENVTP